MVHAAFAQTAAPAAAAPSAPDQLINTFAIVAITIGIFYFMIIRPQQKKQRETDLMLQSIRKGDRVLTSGGIFGTVVGEKGDKGEVVVVKVSEEVKMEFTRQSIVQVTHKGE